MAISLDEVIDLHHRLHTAMGIDKRPVEELVPFFIHPEPRIFIAHDEDLSLQGNWEIHQRIVDESFDVLDPWDIWRLCDDPERARATGAVLWKGRSLDDDSPAPVSIVVGEDWIVQRAPEGDIRFALYLNTYHQSLPGSSAFSIRASS